MPIDTKPKWTMRWSDIYKFSTVRKPGMPHIHIKRLAKIKYERKKSGFSLKLILKFFVNLPKKTLKLIHDFLKNIIRMRDS